MTEITFEIPDQTAHKWKVMLGNHFADLSRAEPSLAKTYREAGLNVLTRFAMFEFVRNLAVADSEKAEAAMSETEKI